MKNQNDKIITVLTAKNPAKHLSENLNHLMARQSIDGVRLSKNTGIPITTINRLRKNDPGNNPTLMTLVPLAEFFSITVSELIGDMLLSAPQKSISRSASIDCKHIPHLLWEEAIHWQKNKKIEPRYKTVACTVSDDAFALTMEGDSMSPRFSEGTLLVIEPRQKINNRDFVVVLPKRSNRPQLKQILMDGSDCYIKSLNDDFKEIKKIFLNKDHKIIGIVVQAIINFNNDEQNE